MRQVDSEEISLEAVGSEGVTLTLGGQKFWIDQETLCDLTYRMAAALSFLENQEPICPGCRGSWH